jgi:hypothetical protein
MCKVFVFTETSKVALGHHIYHAGYVNKISLWSQKIWELKVLDSIAIVISTMIGKKRVFFGITLE